MAAIREALSHQVLDMPFQTSLTLKKVGDLISKLEKTSFSKAEIERLRMPLTLLLERIVFEFKPGKTEKLARRIAIYIHPLKDLLKIRSYDALRENALELSTCSNIPSSIGLLTHLERLTIKEGTFTTLPNALCLLYQLQELIIAHNPIERLPKYMGNFIHLTKLTLSRNRLTHLPESICQMLSLTHLYADCNQLSTLPNNFNRLTTLVEINLRKNQFTNIPEVLFLFSFNLVTCFRMNPIPVVTARSLRQRISHPDYKGPQIHFLVNRFAKIP